MCRFCRTSHEKWPFLEPMIWDSRNPRRDARGQSGKENRKGKPFLVRNGKQAEDLARPGPEGGRIADASRDRRIPLSTDECEA